VVCECGHLSFTGNVPQGHNFVIRETGYVCVITGEKTTMNRAVDSEEKLISNNYGCFKIIYFV
jgi:hypothetical protein